MNLLVTNTRNAQAYAIIRALRPHAQKVVATMEGDNHFAAGLSHAGNSRLVDKKYYTPSPAADWRAGRIQRENTEREEAYIRVVETICEQERIDIVFPWRSGQGSSTLRRINFAPGCVASLRWTLLIFP